MMVKIKLLQVRIVALLVLQILCVNGTANNDIQQIPYSLGATTQVCVLPIDYNNCSYPGIKLNHHPPTSSSTVGTLVYNKLYSPDRVAAKANTTEYGFVDVTSERNDSSLCLYFMGMSVLASGLTFSLEQFCGVTELDLEKKYCFKFILVHFSTSMYPPTTRIGNIISSSSATNTSTSSSYTSRKPNENQRNKKFSSGQIFGIIIGVLVAISFPILIVVLYCKFKNRLN